MKAADCLKRLREVQKLADRPDYDLQGVVREALWLITNTLELQAKQIEELQAYLNELRRSETWEDMRPTPSFTRAATASLPLKE